VVWTLKELADRAGAELEGDGSGEIVGVSALEDARPGTVTFLSNPKFRRFLKNTRAAAVILRREDASACPVPALLTDNPYLTYARVAALLYPQEPVRAGAHRTAVVAGDAKVDPSAWLGPNAVIERGVEVGPEAFIGPGCVVGKGSRVGARTRLVANVSVGHDCVIGSDCLIHPGVVIGADGFGIANDGGRWVKVPQIGRVVIGDHVEIGANTTVDRGAIHDTVIEEGVKIDNLVQVAHNVHIGAHTAIAGCTGIAGSAKIGAHCAIGGGVGIAGHLEICDGVQLTGMSFVTKSVREPGVYSSGMPLETNEAWQKNIARYRHLDEMARRLRALEKKIDKD